MANYANIGFNNLYTMMLCERNGGHPKYTQVQVQFISDIISTDDYIPKIQVQFPYYTNYNASRGDVLIGVNGGSEHWNIMDTYLAQNMDNAVPIALDTIDDNKKIYTFVPVPFLQNDGMDTYTVRTFQTKRVATLNIINNLGRLMFNVLNQFSSQIDFNFDNYQYQKLFRFDPSYQPVLQALDEMVEVNHGSKKNDPTQQATEKQINVLNKYNELISALPERRVVYYKEHLYLERGKSALQSSQQIFPVDIHTLYPTSIKKEAYRNNAKKHNVAQLTMSLSGKSEDNTSKKRELIGFYKNGNPRYRTKTIHNKKVTPAQVKPLGVYAISGDYGLLHTMPDSHGIFNFHVNQPSVVNIIDKTVTGAVGQQMTNPPASVAKSNIDLLIDRDDSSITINGNVRESWMKPLTESKKGVKK